jgi:hypothetical protein
MDLSKYLREDDKIKLHEQFSWYGRNTWKGYGKYRKRLTEELEWLRTKVDDKIQLEYYRNAVNDVFKDDAFKRDLIEDISKAWIREILFLRSMVHMPSQFEHWISSLENSNSPITNKPIMTNDMYRNKWKESISNIPDAQKLVTRWNTQIPKVFQSYWYDLNPILGEFVKFCNISKDSKQELTWLREKVGNDKELEYFREGGSLENESNWLIKQVDKLDYWKWKNNWMSSDEFTKEWNNHIGNLDYVSKLKEHYDNQPNIPEEFIPKSDDNCSICLCPFDTENTTKKILKCGHYFHSECVSRWISEGKNTCPICRDPINDTPNRNSSLDHLEEGELEIELHRWNTGSNNNEEYYIDLDTGDVYIELIDNDSDFRLVGYRMPNNDTGNFIQIID